MRALAAVARGQFAGLDEACDRPAYNALNKRTIGLHVKLFAGSIYRDGANNHNRVPHHHADFPRGCALSREIAAVLKRDQNGSCATKWTSPPIDLAEHEAARHNMLLKGYRGT